MMKNSAGSKPRFCSECGTQFLANARFCHSCGAAADGSTGVPNSSTGLSPLLKWGLPAVALAAVVLVSVLRLGDRGPVSQEGAPLAAAAIPDINSMSPVERADRLFNRVMTLSTEGKADSVAIFAPMALTAIESLTPLSTHLRYDIGLVALAANDLAKASAESDTILKERPHHLLALSLAAKVADARGDSAKGRTLRKRMLAAEKAERADSLPEYRDHDADLRAALDLARKN